MASAPQLTPADVVAAMRDEDAMAIDVREAAEWRAGHMGDSEWIPLGDLAGCVDGLPRDRPLVIVCRTGSRSGYAADALAAAGYDARNLAGGLCAWDAAGLPLFPAGGTVI